MNVELIEGSAAEALLADVAFREQWNALVALCPWATVYQGPAFCAAWYRAYRGRFAPVLAMSRTSDGRLDGMLALAGSESERRFGVAGLWQAEYQCWICRPELAETFPPVVIEKVRDRLPAAELLFRYLPGNAPTAWLGRGRMNHLTESFRRPVLRLKEMVVDESAKSSKGRSYKTLSRLGKISIVPVNTAAELNEFLDLGISWHDIRRLAINNAVPFSADSRKRAFHVEMINEPGLARVTKLMTGDKLVSFQFQLRDAGGIRMHVLGHDPMLAHQSPGRVHAQLLVDEFLAEGQSWFDLTAGGESYKDELANGHDTVYSLTVYTARTRWAVGLLARVVSRVAKRALKLSRVSPMEARLRITRLRRLGLTGLAADVVRRGVAWCFSNQHILLYRRNTNASPQPEPAQSPFQRNLPRDLLAYEPPSRWPSRHEFAADALDRVARRQNCYTLVESGRLQHITWLIERPSAVRLESQVPGISLPPDSALIVDTQTMPDSRRRGLARQALEAISLDLGARGLKQLYVAVSAGDQIAINLFEKSGFVRDQQTMRSIRFGRRLTRKVPTERPLAQRIPQYAAQTSDA